LKEEFALMALQRIDDYDEDGPLYGIPMTREAFEALISIEGPYNYELLGGRVYAMAPPSPEHSVISANITEILRAQLGKRGPCRVYQEQYVAIPGNNPSCQPDVVMTCDERDWDKKKRLMPFRVRSPRLVVEILSPSTESLDRGEKFARYILCPTLEVYMLVNQAEAYIEVYRQKNNWVEERYTENAVIMLETMNLELPLTAVYEGVL
jgi:Uma2 family endonuclease